MKTWYLKLSKEQKNDLLQYKDTMKSYAKEYSLTFDTVRERFAQQVLSESKGDEQYFFERIEDSLAKARALAVKRKKVFSKKFTVYNGLITQALLGHRDIVAGNEEIHFVDCEKYLRHVHWHDILTLSAIYNVIADSSYLIDSEEGVTISIDKLYNMVMQSKNKTAPEAFIERVRNTISRLRGISGCYTQDKKNYPIYPTFFLDSNLDDRGYLMLSAGYEYLELCNKQKRLAGIDRSIMSLSETFDEQILRTYIMWRISTDKNEHSKSTSNAISIETMQEQTGIDLDENWKTLISVCRSLKVKLNSNRIWWD